jgi:hypothetical protein
MSLLVTVFVIEFICYLVLSIGAKPINDLVGATSAPEGRD